MKPKLAMLNASLIGRGRVLAIMATAEPTTSAARYSSGGRKKNPMTAENSLAEKEWVSRRKWTSTTFVSAIAIAAAITGQGTGKGVTGPARSRRARNAIATLARPSAAVSDQIFADAVSDSCRSGHRFDSTPG